MRRRRDKRKNLFTILFLLLAMMGFGYAYLNADLDINGIANVPKTTWDIHFENIVINPDSVELSASNQAATISENQKQVTYTVTLKQPGDFYEFTVDAVNKGTIDGMVESVTSKMNGVEITTLPNYLKYSVTYYDDIPIENHHYLKKGESETYKVRIEYNSDLTAEDLPGELQSYSFSFSVSYLQADDNAIEVVHRSFATDSWETIINNVQQRRIPSYYQLGDEKEVDLGELGIHSVRIVNMSTPTECNGTGFSQSACGFVLEFTSVIGKEYMNPQLEFDESPGYGNIGGWPATHMREWLNTTFLNELPSVLRNNIYPTRVVSGHNCTETDNYRTDDKIYLPSVTEIYGTNIEDTATEFTRRLDYYNDENCTTNECRKALKKLTETFNYYSYLRTPLYFERCYDKSDFRIVDYEKGKLKNDFPFHEYGASPIFRLDLESS